ncbi:glycosyltransferase [Enterococcus pseudoavium]|uniref:glycosyltransferase n=1 Tax=Enterococcus pseudoavium TaxID=44007 RepID=UPI0028926000|nr:glycosyltransferase [Enterococcus pseudoavium]MDT2755347.1 glycosyltransferase [Enterococcus pseudoavium]
MKKVIILMSTYNGQKYLEEQLDSIILQTYSEIEIYIRDDGSSDETIDILKRYCKNYTNINVDFGENVGYPECFYKLTDKKLDGDYFMFADQDDYWLPFKVERAVKSLTSESSNGSVCYYSSYNICDNNLNFIRESPNKDKKFTLKDTLFEVCGLEFTMALNRQAFDLLNIYRPINSSARGTWMSMLFSSSGKVLYDNVATANYRRHEDAVTSPNMGNLGLFLWRVKKFLLGENLNNYKNMLKEFREIMGDNLSTQEKEILSIFCENHDFFGSTKKIFYPQRLRSSILDELQLRILFLLKKI